MDWEFGVGRCKLLYLEWINNKVLLYSTGNDIQSPGINHTYLQSRNRDIDMWTQWGKGRVGRVGRLGLT